MNKESIKKVSNILWKIAKIFFVITLIAYIALMTYAITDLQKDVYELTKKIDRIEQYPDNFYVTFCDKEGNSMKQIHYKVDEDPSLTWTW